MNRSYILGIAILTVIVYHFFCWVYNPIGALNVGYVGVDIFLFFSGLGLSFSFEKNSLKDFYKRRFFKVYPLYFILACLSIAITTESYLPVSNVILNSFLKLTTISYYVDVENSIDWYLNSLFLFYLLFPLLYYLCKKYGFKLYIFMILVSTSILGLYILIFKEPIHWKYDCFVGRIPVFCLGIIGGLNKYTENKINKFTLYNIIPAIPLRFLSLFLSISFIAPILILICNKASFKFKSTKLEFLGNHTLELYCANVIVARTVPFVNSIFHKALLFIVIQIIMSFFFIYVNKLIQRCIFKTNKKAPYPKEL